MTLLDRFYETRPPVGDYRSLLRAKQVRMRSEYRQLGMGLEAHIYIDFLRRRHDAINAARRNCELFECRDWNLG